MTVWAKTGWSNAAQVLGLVGKPFEIDADDMLPPDAYCRQLVDAAQLGNAATFIGHALPRYETIVWAVQALRTSAPNGATDPVLTEILRWVDDPTDERRRAIFALADAAGGDSATSLLGYAVFMSGGSISGPDLPAILPPADVCAKLACGAVLKAAYSAGDPQAALLSAIKIGESVAANGAVA
jgi:hypothetical protein